MKRLLTERLLEAADRVPPLAAHDLRALLEVTADTIIRLDEELVAVRDEAAPDVDVLVEALISARNELVVLNASLDETASERALTRIDAALAAHRKGDE